MVTSDPYTRYRDACEAENLEPHTRHMWNIHGRPTGPIGTTSDRYCDCGHRLYAHELRAGGRLGCIITGCLCIDFHDEIGDDLPPTDRSWAPSHID